MKRIFCCLLLLSGCDSSDPPLQPAGIGIRNVGYAGAALDLEVRITDVPRDGNLLRQAGTVVLRIGHDLAADNPPVRGPLKVIKFIFIGPSKTAEAAGSKLVHLTYDVQELRALAKTEADADTILGSATEGGTWGPANDDVVQDYCRIYVEGEFCTRLNTR